jgi:hypothetical protein
MLPERDECERPNEEGFATKRRKSGAPSSPAKDIYFPLL